MPTRGYCSGTGARSRRWLGVTRTVSGGGASNTNQSVKRQRQPRAAQEAKLLGFSRRLLRLQRVGNFGFNGFCVNAVRGFENVGCLLEACGIGFLSGKHVLGGGKKFLL